MKYLLFVGFALLFSSCIIEKETVLEAEMYNSTDHTIKLLTYRGGICGPKDTTTLNPKITTQIGASAERGDIKGPGFNSFIFGGPDDSLIVIFDDSYRVSHYCNTPSNLSGNYYLFTSLRNILHPNSYEFKRVRGKKRVYHNMHKYIFSEDDYLNAIK